MAAGTWAAGPGTVVRARQHRDFPCRQQGWRGWSGTGSAPCRGGRRWPAGAARTLRPPLALAQQLL